MGHLCQPNHHHLLKPTTTKNFSQPAPSEGDEKCPTKNRRNKVGSPVSAA
ncbi:hypothetical protein Y032_0454g1728, partial [Ancylostoma ceylanicum]